MAGVSSEASVPTHVHNKTKEGRTARKMAMLAKCLPHKREHLNSASSTHTSVSGIVVHISNPRAWEVETGRSLKVAG